MSTRPTVLAQQSNTHSIPEILGHERIDLTRLKKQAQLSQTRIPKIPRITRTLTTLQSVLKVLEEHSRTSKNHIDQLIQSVEQENHQFTRQLHECQVAYLKLQAHTASLHSLKECYCRYAQMLDGARTMYHAYQQAHTKRDSIDQVKLGLKECTQTLCAIEAQLESMLGSFVLNLQEISGFSRLCPGDEYELVLRYGQQKWKTRGRIPKHHHQSEQHWTRQTFHLKAKLADLFFLKISEVKLLGVALKSIGSKCFEVNNFYSIDTQRMIINADQSGTIKLLFLVQWDLYDQVDTKFTFYNPNRSYTDVTRTWSMFVGNTTLLRTVNDAVSSKRMSTVEPPVHYEEILPRRSPLSFSDEISSIEEEEGSESIYELDLLIEQVRTSLDDLRCDRLEELLSELDRRIKEEIHEQTAKTLEIEKMLSDFNFLHNIDEEEEESSKTIDSGFEGEHRTWHFLFIEILHRVLLLLHYIHNRSKSDDQLVFDRLDEQCEQLAMAMSWNDQALAQCQPAIGQFWSSTDTFLLPFERCLEEMIKSFPCTQEQAEFLLDNLCCLPFRAHRPKSLSLIEVSFLWNRREAMLELAREQLALQAKFSTLISNGQWAEIALLLNRRTLNNEKIIDRLLKESDLNLPDEFLSLLIPPIRQDLIVQLRRLLSSHPEHLAQRLQIHKLIFHLQQLDSL